MISKKKYELEKKHQILIHYTVFNRQRSHLDNFDKVQKF